MVMFAFLTSKRKTHNHYWRESHPRARQGKPKAKRQMKGKRMKSILYLTPLIVGMVLTAYFFLKGHAHVPRPLLVENAAGEDIATASPTIASHFRGSARAVPAPSPTPKFDVPATQHADPAKLNPRQQEILNQTLREQAGNKTPRADTETKAIEVQATVPLFYSVSDHLYKTLSPQEQKALDDAAESFEEMLSKNEPTSSEDYFWDWQEAAQASDGTLQAYLGWQRFIELSWEAKK